MSGNSVDNVHGHVSTSIALNTIVQCVLLNWFPVISRLHAVPFDDRVSWIVRRILLYCTELQVVLCWLCCRLHRIIVQNFIVLRCIIFEDRLYCIGSEVVLHCILLNCTMLYCITDCVVLGCVTLYYILVYCILSLGTKKKNCGFEICLKPSVE